jgi:3'5'-cyclic nucleotide phosphodiesterase
MGHLKREEFREFRTIVIETVLATDMSLHFSQVKNIKALLKTERYDRSWESKF